MDLNPARQFVFFESLIDLNCAISKVTSPCVLMFDMGKHYLLLDII